MIQNLVQIVAAGLAMGAVYVLIALGYTLIWNAVSVVNFAQGDLVMLGAFVGVGFLANLLHLPVLAQVAGVVLLTALFGLAVAWGVYYPVRKAPQISAVVATLGLSMFLQNASVLVWGPEPLFFSGPFGNGTTTVMGAKISDQYLLITAVLAVLIGAQQAVFKTTAIGRALRATAQDPEAARLMGISTNRVVAFVFAYATVLAGIAGWLLAPLFYVSADMGVSLSLKAFAATILGGFGSIPGAVLGGLALGLIEQLGSFYISAEYVDVIAFGVLLLVLVFRPQGVFGELSLERP
jgi:branched-chain amino acid transport system permease protein